jgi:protocatechuate 3,4-dioxygenase, beta subunit
MKTLSFILLTSTISACMGQPNNDRAVGGRCETCEHMFQGMPASISSRTLVAKANEPGERLHLKGNVYRKDGKTPASNVVLYFYHTDNTGLYSRGTTSDDQGPHGRLRGWVRTDEKGTYEFETIRPASYPNSRAPQHIHMIVKEPGVAPYWIDDFVFTDDPFVDEEYSGKQQNRGGSGVISLVRNNSGIWQGRRDLILGLNVPGY